MDLTPPDGSKISISHDDVDPTIIIPAKASASRFFGGAFLLFWLAMWAFAFRATASQLMSGKGGPFLIFWLAGWTVGGFLAALSAYRIFRPGVPETLSLKRGGIGYDSGIRPLELNSSNRGDYWKSLFAKRVRADLTRQQLQSLRLRETETGNRLTLDLGAQRIELASQASEVEREWLARLLARRYSLPQVSGGAPSAGTGV